MNARIHINICTKISVEISVRLCDRAVIRTGLSLERFTPCTFNEALPEEIMLLKISTLNNSHRY